MPLLIANIGDAPVAGYIGCLINDLYLGTIAWVSKFDVNGIPFAGGNLHIACAWILRIPKR